MELNSVLIAVLAGLGGMFGWGFADLFAKKTIDAIGDTVTLVVAHVFGTATVVLVAVYAVFVNGHVFQVPSSPGEWGVLAFFGALQALVYLLMYRGFGKGQVAILSPIFSSFPGLTSLLSVLFFGEILSGHILFALALIFVGILVMNLDMQALRAKRFSFLQVPGFFEIALATILAAFWTLGWSQVVDGVDWLSYAVYMYVFMTIALLLYARVQKISLKISHAPSWKYLALIGLAESGAYIAISWGYGITSFTSIVAILSGTCALPVIVGSRLWLKERTTRFQLIGSLIIVIGVVLVAVL